MPSNDNRRKQLRWRAHHRGIKEADMLLGAFADRWLAQMTEAELGWFDALMEEQDVDILAWAFRSAEVPAELQGEMMQRLQTLEYFTPLARR